MSIKKQLVTVLAAVCLTASFNTSVLAATLDLNTGDYILTSSDSKVQLDDLKITCNELLDMYKKAYNKDHKCFIFGEDATTNLGRLWAEYLGIDTDKNKYNAHLLNKDTEYTILTDFESDTSDVNFISDTLDKMDIGTLTYGTSIYKTPIKSSYTGLINHNIDQYDTKISLLVRTFDTSKKTLTKGTIYHEFGHLMARELDIEGNEEDAEKVAWEDLKTEKLAELGATILAERAGDTHRYRCNPLENSEYYETVISNNLENGTLTDSKQPKVVMILIKSDDLTIPVIDYYSKSPVDGLFYTDSTNFDIIVIGENLETIDFGHSRDALECIKKSEVETSEFDSDLSKVTFSIKASNNIFNGGAPLFSIIDTENIHTICKEKVTGIK